MRRRDFLLGATALPAAGVAQPPLFAFQRRGESRVPLGFDGHSMRAMKCKAPQFISFKMSGGAGQNV